MKLNLFIYIFSGRFNQTIHPASEENVQAAREEITHRREAQQQTDDTFESQQQRPITENHGQHDCPICLATTQFAVQTNCGHLFCGNNWFIAQFFNVQYLFLFCLQKKQCLSTSLELIGDAI